MARRLAGDSSRRYLDSGVSDRVLTAGYKHEGIDLRFGGESHRIDFTDLVGEAVWLYPQNEVFIDLAAARERDDGQAYYSVTDTSVADQTTDTPKIRFVDAARSSASASSVNWPGVVNSRPGSAYLAESYTGWPTS